MELSFKLSQFEGPLDLLLHLIGKAKIAIEDIFVSDITEQYLAYLDSVHELDMEAASDFLATAATLLEIKSRSLLPKPPAPEDEEDPEQVLIRRLKEYQMFKQSAQELKEQEETRIGAYYKLPQEMHYDERFEITGVSMEMLLGALQDVISRVQKRTLPPAVREIKRDLFSVKDKISLLKRSLGKQKHLEFQELFQQDTSKSEVVTTFMALLELWKLHFLTIRQDALFGGITVSLVEE